MGGFSGYKVFWGFTEEDLEMPLSDMLTCQNFDKYVEVSGQGKYFDPGQCGDKPCDCMSKGIDVDWIEVWAEGILMHGFTPTLIGYVEPGYTVQGFAYEASIIEEHLNEVRDLDLNPPPGAMENLVKLMRDFDFRFKKDAKIGWKVAGIFFP